MKWAVQAIEQGEELTTVFASVIFELAGEVDTPELRDRLGRVAEEPAELIGHLVLHVGKSTGAPEAMIALIGALKGSGAALNEKERGTRESANGS